MSKWFTIKYFDMEVDVKEEELQALYKAWKNNPIAIRKDGTALTDRFVHILPSSNAHHEDRENYEALPEHELTTEEIEREREEYKRGREALRKKLTEKYHWKFNADGKVIKTF